MNNLIHGLQYIIKDPFFCKAMVGTIITSLFIGATLHNGNLRSWAKGVVTLLSYAFFLVITTSARINNLGLSHTTFGATYASLATTFAITVAYLIGLTIGVLVTYYVYHVHDWIENKIKYLTEKFK